jgi:hypothetical protein
MSLELHNGVQFRVRLQKIMIQYTSSPGAHIPFNERILQGFKKMDKDIHRIMCVSQGEITAAPAQEYNKNQEVVRQAC